MSLLKFISSEENYILSRLKKAWESLNRFSGAVFICLIVPRMSFWLMIPYGCSDYNYVITHFLIFHKTQTMAQAAEVNVSLTEDKDTSSDEEELRDQEVVPVRTCLSCRCLIISKLWERHPQNSMFRPALSPTQTTLNQSLCDKFCKFKHRTKF